nr:uncharacterized protein LOC125181915 isoform X2 [Anser cygnoides]
MSQWAAVAMSPWCHHGCHCDTAASKGTKRAAPPGAGAGEAMEAEGAKGSLEHAQESLENMAEVLAQVAQARAGVEAALEEFLKCKRRRAELEEAVAERASINKALREEIKNLQERREVFKTQTARGKRMQAAEAPKTWMQEMVAAQLDEELASRRHRISTWLRRLVLSFAGLQLAFLILVLLKRDILHWILPPGLASALGSHPPDEL